MTKKINTEIEEAAAKAIELMNELAADVAEVEAIEAQAPAIDISAIVAAIPAIFTPAILDKAFNLNDGGKTARRHLRKHFSEVMAHNHKDKWTFSNTDTAIIEYFAARYTFNAQALLTK